MSTLESLDAVLKDFEETNEKVKASIVSCVQKHLKILTIIEQLYIDESHKQEDLNSRVKTLNDKLQQLFSERNVLASEENSLRNNKKDVLDRIEEKDYEVAIQEKKIASRRTAVSLYEECLCMKIKNVGEGHLVFIFKNIDPVRPDSCCLFQLLVENKIYKVTRCEPELPDVDVFLSELNATNNLYKFIVSMRERFLQIACFS